MGCDHPPCIEVRKNNTQGLGRNVITKTKYGTKNISNKVGRKMMLERQ